MVEYEMGSGMGSLEKVQETTSDADFQACVTFNSWKSV